MYNVIFCDIRLNVTIHPKITTLLTNFENIGNISQKFENEIPRQLKKLGHQSPASPASQPNLCILFFSKCPALFTT